MTGPLGEPVISPGDFAAFVEELIASRLPEFPVELRAEIESVIRQLADDLRPQPQGVKAGETLLFGEAAQDAIRTAMQEALDARGRGPVAGQ